MKLAEFEAGYDAPRTTAEIREQAQADYREMVGMTLEAPQGQLITLDTPAAEIERREAAAHRLGRYLGFVLASDTFDGCHDPRQLGQGLADLLAKIADEAYLELEYADDEQRRAEKPATVTRASA